LSRYRVTLFDLEGLADLGFCDSAHTIKVNSAYWRKLRHARATLQEK
jgi:hypothetical protein